MKCLFSFSLLTGHGTGYEIFIDYNGKLFVGILTRKEYYAASGSGASLVDKRYVISKKKSIFYSINKNMNNNNFRWHLITVGIIPPKRPFAYTQISCYIDGHQRLGATIKLGSFTDVCDFC